MTFLTDHRHVNVSAGEGHHKSERDRIGQHEDRLDSAEAEVPPEIEAADARRFVESCGLVRFQLVYFLFHLRSQHRRIIQFVDEALIDGCNYVVVDQFLVVRHFAQPYRSVHRHHLVQEVGHEEHNGQ